LPPHAVISNLLAKTASAGGSGPEAEAAAASQSAAAGAGARFVVVESARLVPSATMPLSAVAAYYCGATTAVPAAVPAALIPATPTADGATAAVPAGATSTLASSGAATVSGAATDVAPPVAWVSKGAAASAAAVGPASAHSAPARAVQHAPAAPSAAAAAAPFRQSAGSTEAPETLEGAAVKPGRTVAGAVGAAAPAHARDAVTAADRQSAQASAAAASQVAGREQGALQRPAAGSERNPQAAPEPAAAVPLKAAAVAPSEAAAAAPPQAAPAALPIVWLAEERQAALLALTSRHARLHELLGGEYPALFPAPAAPTAAAAVPASALALVAAGGLVPAVAGAVNGAGSRAATPTPSVGAAVGVGSMGSTGTAGGAAAHGLQPAAVAGQLPDMASALLSPFWAQAASAAAAPAAHALPPLPPDALAPLELSLFREARVRWGLAPPAAAAPVAQAEAIAALGGTPPSEVAGSNDGSDGSAASAAQAGAASGSPSRVQQAPAAITTVVGELNAATAEATFAPDPEVGAHVWLAAGAGDNEPAGTAAAQQQQQTKDPWVRKASAALLTRLEAALHVQKDGRVPAATSAAARQLAAALLDYGGASASSEGGGDGDRVTFAAALSTQTRGGRRHGRPHRRQRRLDTADVDTENAADATAASAAAAAAAAGAGVTSEGRGADSPRIRRSQRARSAAGPGGGSGSKPAAAIGTASLAEFATVLPTSGDFAFEATPSRHRRGSDVSTGLGSEAGSSGWPRVGAADVRMHTLAPAASHKPQSGQDAVPWLLRGTASSMTRTHAIASEAAAAKSAAPARAAPFRIAGRSSRPSVAAPTSASRGRRASAERRLSADAGDLADGLQPWGAAGAARMAAAGIPSRSEGSDGRLRSVSRAARSDAPDPVAGSVLSSANRRSRRQAQGSQPLRAPPSSAHAAGEASTLLAQPLPRSGRRGRDASLAAPRSSPFRSRTPTGRQAVSPTRADPSRVRHAAASQRHQTGAAAAAAGREGGAAAVGQRSRCASRGAWHVQVPVADAPSAGAASFRTAARGAGAGEASHRPSETLLAQRAGAAAMPRDATVRVGMEPVSALFRWSNGGESAPSSAGGHGGLLRDLGASAAAAALLTPRAAAFDDSAAPVRSALRDRGTAPVRGEVASVQHAVAPVPRMNTLVQAGPATPPPEPAAAPRYMASRPAALELFGRSPAEPRTAAGGHFGRADVAASGSDPRPAASNHVAHVARSVAPLHAVPAMHAISAGMHALAPAAAGLQRVPSYRAFNSMGHLWRSEQVRDEAIAATVAALRGGSMQ
jgi:hypothetical protein